MDHEDDLDSPDLPSKGNSDIVSVDDFQKAYGISFSDAIDVNTWRLGDNLADIIPIIEEQQFHAKLDEKKNHDIYREVVFPKIKEKALVPYAGLHDDVSDIRLLLDKIHKGFLFNGAVTACGSTHVVYDTVPLSIMQIGICLVNYQGQHGSYSHQLYRRDLRFKGDDPVQEALNLIEKRKGSESAKDKGALLSTLALRGIKAYSERSLLLEKKDPRTKWLLGSGTPAPYELMTGFWGSQKEMKDKSIELMSRIILEHERFVYVQNSEKNKPVWTLGSALRPFEYLIIDSVSDALMERVDLGGTRGQIREDYKAFAKEVGSKVAMGVYKISNYSQPQIFYGHVDHIRTAALVAMADSIFQLHRGSPMLLDLAEHLCRQSFGKNDFLAVVNQASYKADAKLRDLTETI